MHACIFVTVSDCRGSLNWAVAVEPLFKICITHDVGANARQTGISSKVKAEKGNLARKAYFVIQQKRIA